MACRGISSRDVQTDSGTDIEGFGWIRIRVSDIGKKWIRAISVALIGIERRSFSRLGYYDNETRLI